MKIDMDENMTSMPKTQRRTKTKASTSGKKKTPEEKIAELCKKEKWTAKDAGHYLFCIVEGEYTVKGFRVSSEQWNLLNDRVNAFDEEAEAEFETYSDICAFFTMLHDYAFSQVESLTYGISSNHSLFANLAEIEKIEKNLDAEDVDLKEDPFRDVHDLNYFLHGGYVRIYDETIDKKIDPCWRWLTAWNVFVQGIGKLYGFEEECFNLCFDLTSASKEINRTNLLIKRLSKSKNLSSRGESVAKAYLVQSTVEPYAYKDAFPKQNRVSHVKEVMVDEKENHPGRIRRTGSNTIYYLAEFTERISGIED